MTRPVLLRAGLRSWLVEVGTAADARSLHRHLAARRDQGALRGVDDLVPGARTVLIDGAATGPDRAAVLTLLADWDPTADPPERDGRLVEIPVRYDGADLDEVSRLTGLSRDEVVALHTGTELRVAFCGFSPGFAYLSGLPARLRVPRRATPRTAVPAGAVALADDYTSIYPRRSPGGWQLIGHSSVRLWDETRREPALLTPGTRVRFVAVPG